MGLERPSPSWADWMAVFWVHPLFTLPVILENLGMGDEPPPRRRPLAAVEQFDPGRDGPSSHKDNDPEHQPIMQVDHHSSPSTAMGHTGQVSALNMGQMTSVLPNYPSPHVGAPSYQQGFPLPANTTPSTMYQYPPPPPFAGQTRPQYDSSFTRQYHEAFLQAQPSPASFQNYAPSSGYPATNVPGQQQFSTQPYYQSPQQPVPNYSGPYTPPHQAYPGLNTTFNPYSPTYGSRHNPTQVSGQGRQGSGYFLGLSGQAGGEASFATVSGAGGGSYLQPSDPGLSRHSSDSSLRTSVPRGPPRKPRQSGHALWVGNLPPGTNVADLKDHFSRNATKEIESVFLISKSNCAFVNYKTEAACADAMTRFHDSRFQGVRLVCRLRRGSGTTSGGAPAANPSSALASTDNQDAKTASIADGTQHVAEPDQVDEAAVDGEAPPAVAKVKEKFFVVKSLTVEDLEASVRNGIWATQAHNEAALNKAYETAENVYLIFSANKSGEYFGYARMASSIGDEAASKVEPPTRTGPVATSLTDLPATIPTPATEFAPKGRIIDDSARGTIFWEADFDSEDEEQQKPDDPPAERGTESDDPEAASPATPQSFGKPFKIEWLSTDRLPFYRTRGLRNPWNANREVKIARDGTELEPSVGRRLLGMFHKPPLAPSSAHTRGLLPQAQAYQSNTGYMQQPPPGRPY